MSLSKTSASTSSTTSTAGICSSTLRHSANAHLGWCAGRDRPHCSWRQMLRVPPMPANTAKRSVCRSPRMPTTPTGSRAGPISCSAMTSSFVRMPARCEYTPTAKARRSSFCAKPEGCWSAATSTSRATPRELVERPRRPTPAAQSATATAAAQQSPKATKRPKSFAEDWNARGSPRPPTTIANPETDIQPPPPVVAPHSIGDRYRRLSVEELAGVPYVDYVWGGIDLSPDGSEVAFSWNRSGTFEIYSVPLDGERIFQLRDAME